MTDHAVVLLGAGKMGAALVDRWVEAGRPVRLKVGPWTHVSPELQYESIRDTLDWGRIVFLLVEEGEEAIYKGSRIGNLIFSRTAIH